MLRFRPCRAALAVLAASACGRSGGTDRAADVSRPPTSAGDVWEADSVASRAAAPAALVAFVNGVHVMIVDGDDAYAGMTRLALASTAGGARALRFANGLSAELLPAGDAGDTGDAMSLRFSSGETLRLRRRGAERGR